MKGRKKARRTSMQKAKIQRRKENESTLVQVKRRHDDDPTRSREVCSCMPTSLRAPAWAHAQAHPAQSGHPSPPRLRDSHTHNARPTPSLHDSCSGSCSGSCSSLMRLGLARPTQCVHPTHARVHTRSPHSSSPPRAHRAPPRAPQTHTEPAPKPKDSDFASLHPRILAWRIHNERGG
jgi:hypothetical protein